MSTENVDLSELDAEERRDRIRNRVIFGVVAAVAIGVALWVGGIVDDEKQSAEKAQAQTAQAQIEKYNLAQQIAAACADPKAETLDGATYARLCTDAREIVREGPRGAQGIPGRDGPPGAPGVPGVPGVPGIPGVDGRDGADGKDGQAGPSGATGPAGQDGEAGAVGPPGPPGKDGQDGPQGPAGPAGQDGAVGPAGPAGADGEPPYGWVVYGPNNQEIERCERATPFNPDEPRYSCTRSNAVLP